jgi:hypothetical protein
MAGSVLGYRVFRRRRLIAVCLTLIALGAGLGVWFTPGSGALHITFAIGLFSLLTVLHLAIILAFPRDEFEPLASAVGFMVVLAISFPAANAYFATPAELLVGIALIAVFSPVIWFYGVRLLGWAILRPLDFIPLRNVRLRHTAQVDMDMAAARACFFVRPHMARRNTFSGPVEWDGCIAETVTYRVAGMQVGDETKQKTVTRYRVLTEDDASQGLMVQGEQKAGKPAREVVMHQTLAPLGDATLLERRFMISRAIASELLSGRLGDLQADSITSLTDEAMGHAPRANCEEPYDTVTQAINRWMLGSAPGPKF